MITQIPVQGFDNNFCYFVADEKLDEIAVIDPACVSHLKSEIQQSLLIPRMVLLTHSHFDHTEGVPEMVETYGVPVYIHKNARGRLDILETYIVEIEDGDKIKIGDVEILVMHTPGHIDDAVCYYISAEQDPNGVPKLFSGDTVFVEGCGRADLEYSNVKDLYKSLQRIKALPDETEVYPGHDYGTRPFSNIGYEKKHNRFFKCDNFEEFKKMRLPS